MSHTNTKVSVDRSITSGTRQVLVLSVRNVEVRLRVTILLRQTKVNDVNLVAAFANSHQEVVGLDITMDKGLGVNVLDARNKLIGQKENSLQGELPVAEVEQIFQAGTKKVEHHGIVIALGSKPADERDTNTAGKGLVNASLIFKLGMLGLDALELDGDLFSRDNVGAKVDVTEGARSDLSADTVLVTDTQILEENVSTSILRRLRLWLDG